MAIVLTHDTIFDYLRSHSDYIAIVVEGFDGVGKGKLMTDISWFYDVEPYRPDYNFWQKYDLRAVDRWKISGFFWDIFSHFNIENNKVMLFDRGVLSGAVYNGDISIAESYSELLRDLKVLHILVVADEEDYKKFQESRDSEHEVSYEKYLYYTNRYYKALEVSGVDYVIYQNRYLKEESHSDICSGCGHYAYGWCRHPELNCKVDGSLRRCHRSQDLEVQDRNVDEVYRV